MFAASAGASNSPRPSSASSNASSRSGRRSVPGRGVRPGVGPRPNEDVCISEEVKIGINLAVERFRMNEGQKELEFPSSLTATERAYIHRLADDFGYGHKSKGKGAGRYLTITKKDNVKSLKKPATLQLVKNSRQQIQSMLQRFPVTNKERLELMPKTDKNQVNEVSKELARTATGRLNNGVPQVPPRRGESELDSFRQTLPIYQYREQILETIEANQVTLVAGETGSGKTTQVPQLILDHYNQNNKPCRIFCTQPRRIAALSIAERVATERGEKIGQTVGYQIRLESRVSPKTLLTFCTNGVLLRTLMGNDEALSTVTHVIIDEVHERDKFCDFLLISVREVARRQPNIKIVLMSAALNTQLFVKYFSNCPVVSVPGSLFPVEEYYLEDVLKWTRYNSKKMDNYRRDLDRLARQNDNLAKWCEFQPEKQPEFGKSQSVEWQQDDEDRVPDNRDDLHSQLAVLGQEKEELEPWLVREMDQHLTDVWLTGNADLFPQILYLIAEENVSVDYQHSETSITPLMIAAGRGFTDVVAELLNMGADARLKASNDWTALDWAKKFEQEEIVNMLTAHLSAIEDGVHEEEQLSYDDELTDEDRELLMIYQHCWDDDKVDIDLVASLLHKIVVTQPEGAVLIFLPGYDDIVALRSRIDEEKRFDNVRYSLFLLHSAMQSADQKKVFKPSPPGIRKIILATNIAETSITINDVVYVIDAGKVKEKTFDALLQVTMLKSNWISKASALQRRGRAGRVRPGICYHMFSKVRHHNMSDFATPELLRCPLEEICLQTKLLAPFSESISDFLSKAPDAPPFLVTRAAVNILKQMDALDQSEELTELGRHLADLPVDPHLGKMVLNSIVLKCLDPVLTIVCSLSYKDPFLLPPLPFEKRNVAALRKEFSAGTFSDHMVLLRAFQAWQQARIDGLERAFCFRNYLSSAVMEMIVGMRAQLLGQLRASGFVRARGGGDIRDLNTNSENWAVVKAALCAGAYPNIVRYDNKGRSLISMKNESEKIVTHVLSVLPPMTQKQAIRELPSEWLFYEENTRANKLACVRTCTLVSPITIALFAGPSKLPPDALKDDIVMTLDENLNIAGVVEESSDSENEEKDDGKLATLQLGEGLGFKVDPKMASMVLQLRQKWNCLFLRRMRSPSKPWSQIDEAVIRAVVTVLTNEEQALGLQQPAGIGQRPRPMSAETIMSSGNVSRSYENHEHMVDSGHHRFSTSAKKATQTPPKRKDFMSPKINKSNTSSAQNSPQSVASYDSENPFYSPSSNPQQHKITDQGANVTGPNRYFVMKCASLKNIDSSVSKGQWSTSVANEKKFNKALQNGKTVHLIFSVQGSGHFQGYAKLKSRSSQEKSVEFGGQGGVFQVEWIKRGNLPFQSTHHLENPWNESKRVQISRDGQELEPSIGQALTQLWDYPAEKGSPGVRGGRSGQGHSYKSPKQSLQQKSFDGQSSQENQQDFASSEQDQSYDYQVEDYQGQSYGFQGHDTGYHGYDGQGYNSWSHGHQNYQGHQPFQSQGHQGYFNHRQGFGSQIHQGHFSGAANYGYHGNYQGQGIHGVQSHDQGFHQMGYNTMYSDHMQRVSSPQYGRNPVTILQRDNRSNRH